VILRVDDCIRAHRGCWSRSRTLAGAGRSWIEAAVAQTASPDPLSPVLNQAATPFPLGNPGCPPAGLSQSVPFRSLAACLPSCWPALTSPSFSASLRWRRGKAGYGARHADSTPASSGTRVSMACHPSIRFPRAMYGCRIQRHRDKSTFDIFARGEAASPSGKARRDRLKASTRPGPPRRGYAAKAGAAVAGWCCMDVARVRTSASMPRQACKPGCGRSCRAAAPGPWLEPVRMG